MLAGSGGDGMLEVDYNTNPLREELASPFPKIIDSKITLNNNPGLGVTPDFSSLEKYLVYHTLVSN
jgi:L-alanine-DL-glutamate epimerase-like enolase superfamily enzyme